MTNSRVGYLSALRRLCVGHLVGSLGVVILAANGAHAEAWEEFEARCLVPMENFNAPISDNLGADGLTKFPEKLVSRFSAKSGTLSIDTESISGDLLECSFAQHSDTSLRDSDGFVGDFTNWVGQALKSGRYVGQRSETVEPTKNNLIILQSNEWREPVLEVLLFQEGQTAVWIASARETDLES